ncbi:putative quinol monooxygenase [Nocardiopsis protaetiae]|uniref:putative quinol monooxygenase n=1 Tax=Nocardiopsis protaetiae TaxID=3382270 RepID=UPI00387AA633
MSALVGWSATAALAAYAQRRPGVAVIAWFVAALGLTVGLSAAVIGALFDFNGVTFRLLHIGISLLGPLYMAWGALEYGVRSAQGRFTSRLFLAAFTIVPLVVLSMDRISGRFSTTFPALGDHYDLIPRSLVNVTQVVVAVFLVAALAAVARRPAGRNLHLGVLGLVALAALLSIVVGRTGLGFAGPLLMLGSVAALWGAAALAVRPRRDPYDEDDDYYDDYDDDADGDPEDELLEEPVRRKRRNADPYDDYYDGPPVRQAPPAKLRGVITIYTLADGQGAGFDRIADAVVHEVGVREPDTLLFACHTVPSAPLQRIVYAIYRDDLAKEEHDQQPHVIEFGRRTGSHVVATNVIELALSGAAASDGLAALLMPR